MPCMFMKQHVDLELLSLCCNGFLLTSAVVLGLVPPLS